MTIILRPDQAQLKSGIYNGWNSGRRNMLAVLPTGGGKSVIVSDIVLDKNQLGAQQTVIAHRKELVGQMSMHVAERGIMHRIIGPQNVISLIVAKHRKKFGRSFINPSANCSVAGVDTLLARQDDLKDWAAQQDFWTVDEAHHLLRGNKWGRAVELFTNAYGLGVTASPTRADGMGLGRHADGVFDDMIIGPSTRELMDLGAITDYEYVVPASDFQISDDAITDGGDYSPKKMREASKKSRIVGDVVKEYFARAFGKRGIVFATDVETAGEIAANFNAIGIPAASVSAQTPDHVRDDYVERFRDGRLWILVNVDLFGEGFDVPACEVVMMARPTASLAVFLQQAGRALRTFLGKLYGLIIDHVSNYKRHGFPDKKRFWTLDRREKRGKRAADPEEIELTACRKCSRPYEACKPCCPHCGHAPEVTPTGRGSIEQIDGDLILLDRAKLAELRAAAELEAPAEVGRRVGFATGNEFAGKAAINNQIDRIQMQQRLKESIALWAGHQRAMNRDDRQSYRRFYLTTGVDVLSALALPRVEMEKLADTIDGWVK
jgi:superfamily II DNA or RNA helicase